MKGLKSASLSLLAWLSLGACSDIAGKNLDAGEQRIVVEKAIELVHAHYVFADRAERIEQALEAALESGRYTPLGSPDAFLEAVNRDLQEAASDRHLAIFNNPRVVAQLRAESGAEAEPSHEFLEMLREQNYRLRKAESLDGNIGYLKFDSFVELRFVATALSGGMDFLHSSSALVLDLSENGGGASETADFLLGYFLADGTRVGESWERATGKTTASVISTPPTVRPMLDVPVYILVSAQTASAAEAVAYTLQQFKRAVIVGQQTKGMANPGRLFPIDERLYMMVPTIVHRNAISGSNWEGTGVTPDLVAEPGVARYVALEHALLALAARQEDPKKSFALEFAAEEYASLIRPVPPPDGFIAALLGSYDDGTRMQWVDGALRFRKPQSGIDRALRYMGKHTFAVEGRKDYRLRFDFEDGEVSALEVLWYDDTSDRSKKLPQDGS